MVKFIFVGMGYGVNMAIALKKEQNEVGYVFLGDEKNEKITKAVTDSFGIEWLKRGDVTDEDVLIVDDVNVMPNIKYIPTVSIVNNIYADRLENEREVFMSEGKKIGLNVGAYESFNSIGEGIDFIRAERGDWVIKLNGKESLEKWTTYVSKSPEDAIEFLEFLRKYFKKDKISYILQERFKGVEVALSLWGGIYFMNFEYKNFMKMSRYKTGEMGTLLKVVGGNEELVKKSKINELLAKIRENGKYNAPVDINMIVNEDGVYALEPTCRFGYPTIDEMMSMYQGERTMMFMEGIERFRRDAFTDKWAVGIVVAVPPYPYNLSISEAGKVGRIPIMDNVAESNSHSFVVSGVFKDGDVWRTNETGWVGVYTEFGDSIEEANRRANLGIAGLNIPLSFWRSDIGMLDIDNVKKLIEWGYISGGL
jgi:phosphoribosylamine--glycine ligase